MCILFLKLICRLLYSISLESWVIFQFVTFLALICNNLTLGWFSMSLDEWFSNVVPRSLASMSPGNLLEMQIIRPQLMPLGGTQQFVFEKFLHQVHKGLWVAALDCHLFSIPINISLFEIFTVSHLDYCYGFQIGVSICHHYSVEFASETLLDYCFDSAWKKPLRTPHCLLN